MASVMRLSCVPQNSRSCDAIGAAAASAVVLLGTYSSKSLKSARSIG